MSGQRPRPENRNAVSCERRVASCDRQAASERLVDDHAIERIAMVEGQARCPDGMQDGDHLDRKAGKLVPEVGREG